MSQKLIMLINELDALQKGLAIAREKKFDILSQCSHDIVLQYINRAEDYQSFLLSEANKIFSIEEINNEIITKINNKILKVKKICEKFEITSEKSQCLGAVQMMKSNLLKILNTNMEKDLVIYKEVFEIWKNLAKESHVIDSYRNLNKNLDSLYEVTWSNKKSLYDYISQENDDDDNNIAQFEDHSLNISNIIPHHNDYEF